MRLLANENFHGKAVELLRSHGHDVLWIRTHSPGMKDRDVMELAAGEDRILITFDKDFGELAFRSAQSAVPGIILLRLSAPGPDEMADKIFSALQSQKDWKRLFSVIEDSRIRTRPLK